MAFKAGGIEPVRPVQRTELFNGRDFTGWFLFVPDGNPTNTWSVRDGVIHCTGSPAGYIRTVEPYQDYKLTVEWRFLKPGNTGVLVHMSGPDRIWPRSIEAQGLHQNQGDFWVIGGTDFKEHQGLSGRRVPRKGPSRENPVGEWNTYEIICKGDTIRLYVNGHLVNRATECSDTAGHICIQSEGSEFEIRRISLAPAD
ncbi:MAG: DUF1080 domain-containing protein [Verrucomicrobiota bacterium]|nr:DUF1080 domain-containing protein [Limisphaera sp.]MDW8381798.1 DUF1080 domain-containing protein [Verrucomicrobiota bacterium]